MFVQPSQSPATTMTITYPNIPIPPQHILQFHPTYNNTFICLTNISIKQTKNRQKISDPQINTASQQQQQPIQKLQKNQQKMSIVHLSFNGDIINTIEIDRGDYQLGVIYEWEVIVFGTVCQDSTNQKQRSQKLFIWNLVDCCVRNIQYVPQQTPVTQFQLLTFRMSKLFCVCQVIFNQDSPMMGYYWYETKAVKLSYYSVNLEDSTAGNENKVHESQKQSQKQQQQQQQQEGLQKNQKNTQKQYQNLQKSEQQSTNAKHYPQNPSPTKSTKINLLYSTTLYTTIQQIRYRNFNILKINQYSSIAFINRTSTLLKQDYFRIVALQYNENQQLYLSQNQLCFQHVPRKNVGFMGIDDIWQVESQQGMCLYLKFNSANQDNGRYHQFCCIWNYDAEEFLYQELKYELIFHQQIVGRWRDLGRIKNSWSTKYGVQHNQTIYFLQQVDKQYKITGSQTQPKTQPKLIQYSKYDSSPFNETIHPTFLTNTSFNYRYTTDDKFMITQTNYQQVVFNTLQLNTFFMIEMLQEGGCECECDEDLIMKVCELGEDTTRMRHKKKNKCELIEKNIQN